MSLRSNTDDQVLKVIFRSPGSTVDEILLQCPGLTWNQIFIAIDRLNRDGTLKLTSKGRGRYTVYPADNGPQGTSPRRSMDY